MSTVVSFFSIKIYLLIDKQQYKGVHIDVSYRDINNISSVLFNESQ